MLLDYWLYLENFYRKKLNWNFIELYLKKKEDYKGVFYTNNTECEYTFIVFVLVFALYITMPYPVWKSS